MSREKSAKEKNCPYDKLSSPKPPSSGFLTSASFYLTNYMMTTVPYPYLAIGLSLVFWLAFLWLTRKVHFMSPDTDDEYQIRAAAQNHKWRWLSDMHKSGTIKTNTKDGMILLLILFQKLFRNNYSERPLMALYGFSVAVSGLLIFFIGSNYWSSLIGFWLMGLFLLSVWPWQTALYGGHVGVATMAFLASVLAVQQISPAMPNFWILANTGVIFCFMIFSSGSSIKYIPLFFTAFSVSKLQILFTEKGVAATIMQHLLEINYMFDMISLTMIGVFFVFLKIFKKQLVSFLYSNRSFLIKKLNIIRGQEFFPKEHYYKYADKKLPKYFKNLLTAYVGLSATVHFIGWQYLGPFLLGFLALFLVFTLPDIKLNTKNYLRHILSPTRKTRFGKYVEYFAKRRINIADDFRAPLLQWLPRMSWRIAPFQTLLLAGVFLITFSSPVDFVPKILILLISLLPIFWGELTRSTRSLRTYSPSLIGALLFLGYATAHMAWSNLWLYLAIATGIIGIHQMWLFFTDVYPARMALSNLIAILEKYNIREFYTYKTRYNDPLVNAINLERPLDAAQGKPEAEKYKIHFIDNLSDVKEGWIVIPPTNSKSPSMECVPEGMQGDFTKDLQLNKLLETRKIERLAMAKFKTFGTSKVWPQESDVMTYMDLVLKEIGDKERFRGYAWLVNAKALANE